MGWEVSVLVGLKGIYLERRTEWKLDSTFVAGSMRRDAYQHEKAGTGACLGKGHEWNEARSRSRLSHEATMTDANG